MSGCSTASFPGGARVVDFGGGAGHFAAALEQATGHRAEVVDSDPASVALARARRVSAVVGDALISRAADDPAGASFNLILHHLVRPDFARTEALQRGALANVAAGPAPPRVFVHEYRHQSYVAPEFAPAAIHAVTASGTLSRIAAAAARVMPSLTANTFAIGVRFRSNADWRRLFERAGWRVAAEARGVEERISLPRLLALALRSCRRDSFLLERAPALATPRPPH